MFLLFNIYLQILDLYLDDEKVVLPDGIEAVVVLNIPSWGAGVRPWELGSAWKTLESFEPPSICDGLLEIFCIYSSFHIAQMQVTISISYLDSGHGKDIIEIAIQMISK